MIVQWNEDQDDESTIAWVPDTDGSMLTMNMASQISVYPEGKANENGADSRTPDIEILGATTFNDL